MAHSISAIHSHPTAERASRSYKSRRRAPLSENPSSFFRLLPLSSSPLSLLSTSAQRAQRATESERRRPWHRRRPPRRRARSPAGEHAAVERPGRGDPLAEPGEQRARLGLLLPRRRRVFLTSGEVFPFPFPFLLSHPLLLFDLDCVLLFSEPVDGNRV